MADDLFSPTVLDAEGVKTLARRIIQNEIYYAQDATTIDNSFGAILGLFDRPVDWENVGMLYEERHKAGPLAVNGMPMFLSVRFLHKDNLADLISEIDRMKAALA